MTRRRSDAGRPFLKWAGGKSGLLAQYSPHFPKLGSDACYFEPFLGGGAVFFHLRPGRAVLSDVNGELVNAYVQVRDRVTKVVKLLDEHRRIHDHDHYYAVREQDPSSLTPLERAVRFIYLNRTCYNGLWRVNRAGRFNVPLGRYKDPLGAVADFLRPAAKALKGVRVLERPFEAVLREASPGDFVYFDPPYHPVSSTANFTAYARTAFGEAEQRSLAKVFAALARAGVAAMLSNSDTPLVRELYPASRYRVVPVRATRAINSKASGRGAVGEVLVMTYGDDGRVRRR